MTHLSDAELVDAAEHGRAIAPNPHLETCDRCRSTVDRLAAAMREISAIEVPEPSPLFWDHLSSRMHDAVAAEPSAPRLSGWLTLAPWMQMVAFCAIVIAVASIAWVARSSRVTASAVSMASVSLPAAPSKTAASTDTVASANDPAWAVVSAAADDLSGDGTPSAGFAVRPAAIDTAVQQLTPQEREELRRLLQGELKGSTN